jgi:hypothetical protein
MVQKKSEGAATRKPEPSASAMRLGDMSAALFRAQSKMMDTMLRQNIEVLEFLKLRYEKDREMLAQIAGLDDPSAAKTVLTSFWSEALADYTQEAGKLGALAAATTEQLAQGVMEEAKALTGGAPRRSES